MIHINKHSLILTHTHYYQQTPININKPPLISTQTPITNRQTLIIVNKHPTGPTKTP